MSIQLKLFDCQYPAAKPFIGGWCSQAVEHNKKVINNYGPQKFKVVHSGGLIEYWSAQNRPHLDRLLRTQKNLGYMLSVDEIVYINA